MGVIVSKQLKVPVVGKLASDYAVDESVFLMENGNPVEYLIVNQGVPSNSSLYDSSCDGTWLLRKNISHIGMWDGTNTNDYENSTCHKDLNSNFLGRFDTNTQSIIKQVKLPYRKGSGTSNTITSGASGLATKVFLLSTAEVNWFTSSYGQFPADGASVSYFSGCSATDGKRIAYLDGVANSWHTRSPNCYYSYGTRYTTHVMTNGGAYAVITSEGSGIRPALVVPFNALFDDKTNILKGVSG